MIQLAISRHRQGDGQGRVTVITLDPDAQVVATDPYLHEVLGYHPQDLAGRSLKLLIASPEDNPLSGDYASFHENGKPFSITLRHGRGYFMAATVTVQQGPAISTPPPAAAVRTPAPLTTSASSSAEARRRKSIAATRALLDHIRNCLNQDETLPLACQAIEPLQGNDSARRIEILARLPNPKPGGPDLTPADFLAVAERFELSRRLDRRVIRQGICGLLKYPEATAKLDYVGFNLSLGSIEDRSFPAYIRRLLEKTRLPARLLCFEVPARHAVRHPESTRYLCRALGQLGCRVALDGTGATIDSFRHASRLPVDFIKLAPALMARLHEEPSHQVMIEAIQRIARNSSKLTIATSVENDIARSRARSLGLDYVQGRQVGAPAPLRALLRGEWPQQQDPGEPRVLKTGA